MDLRGLASLIKPAILYADTVTIHSPVASMLKAVTDFTDLTHPADQMMAIVNLSLMAPSALPLDFDVDSVPSLEAFLRLTPKQVREVGKATGASRQLDELRKMVDGIRELWETEMPEVTEKIIEEVGARDIIDAIRVGAVQVAPLAGMSTTDHIAGAVLAASGTGSRGDDLDPMFDGFLETVVEVVSGVSGFPLLDPDASGLVKAMEQESVLSFGGAAATRSSEVDAAARFMGFLPYFPDMPLQEVLDLKTSLTAPLVRFRSEMVTLSKDFARPIDDGFAHDVEDAWRQRVEPAIADIRESLAEHGLLKEIASVGLGDVRRLLSEAGGIWAASHADLLKLSGLVSAGLTAAVPALDTTGRAVKETMAARRDARRQGFYFLHKLVHEGHKSA